MADEPKDESMASLGGKARAANMTPEERSESARVAAEARWGDKLPMATHGSLDHPLRIGDIEIPCYVLSDFRRVLTQTGLIEALGMSRGSSSRGISDRLANFIGGNRLKPFINDSLRDATENAIKFRIPTGGSAYGYEATILADVCDAVLAARKAGQLQNQQLHIADRCEILVRSFARVGIIALVDEATGYQYSRMIDELQKILARIISDELAKYTKVIQQDFYQNIARLKGWNYDPTSSRRSHAFAGLTVDLIYNRIHQDLTRGLKSVRKAKGKPWQHLHRWLTTDPEGGRERMKQQAEGVTALLSVAGSWEQFSEWVNKRYPIHDTTLQIPFPDYDTCAAEEKKS